MKEGQGKGRQWNTMGCKAREGKAREGKGREDKGREGKTREVKAMRT
jgi:hypothetical protein